MQGPWEDPQHKDWLAVSAALRRVAARLSGRADVVIRLHPGLPVPRPGRFRLPGGEIMLDAHLVLRPGQDAPGAVARAFPLGLVPPAATSAYSTLLAALTLQSAHAAHTRLDSDDLDDQTLRWVEPLESARVARAQMARRPADRSSLLEALDLLIGAKDDSTSAAWLVRAVTVRAWAAAGVLGGGEAASTLHRMRLRISLEKDRNVAEAIRRAVAAEDGDFTEVLAAAALLGQLLDQSRPDGAVHQEDRPGAGESVVEDSRSKLPDSELRPAPRPRRPSEPNQRQVAAGVRENALAAAARARQLPDSEMAAIRDPEDDLRLGARIATDNLRRALSTVLTAGLVASGTPPGRMNMPELMRRQAQVETRAPVTARPWRQLRRSTITPPRVSIGLSLDSSRSHLPIHSATSDLVWLLATSSRNAAADVAAVSWSNRVSVLVRPGQAPRRVLEPRCHGSSSGCPESLRALTGLLGLTLHDGIRIVVVASDGRLPNRAAVADEVRSLYESGVAVAWVSPTSDGWCPPFAVPISAHPTSVVNIITTLIADSAAQWLDQAMSWNPD